MLGEIAFDHPLFASLAAAQFNDFTKIRFFKYRRIDGEKLGDSRVLARFENHDAALIEKPLGKGKLFVLASGWQRADSQLARSSKFVPLMSALVESGTPHGCVCGQPRSSAIECRSPAGVAGQSGRFINPDGSVGDGRYRRARSLMTPQSRASTRSSTPGGPSSFAVNLDPFESKTAPLAVEIFEQSGVRLANHAQRIARDELAGRCITRSSKAGSSSGAG